jgi:lipopolysaccharide biosynthesis glycosyltransferase
MNPSRATGRNPVIVLAADDGFAMPLAVTVRSALDHLAPERKLCVYVLDGGIGDTTKQRIERSWPAGRFEVSWVGVDATVLERVPVSGHANRVNYFRILMPWLMPQCIERAIYLDADLIIQRDLSELWDCDLAGQVCLAVQDCAAPYLDASVKLPNFSLCGRHLGSITPVPNYRELGLDSRGAYLNSGVLVVDLAAWRAADLPDQMLACLETNREHVRWWDQYALNVVLAGRWGELDLRWNQGSHIFAYPTCLQSPFERAAYEHLRDDPYIIHFTTRYKPWLASCLHPLRGEFFKYLDRTDWVGWRPWKTDRLRVYFELAKAQQRRLRLGRKKLQCRAAEWLYLRRELANSNRKAA